MTEGKVREGEVRTAVKKEDQGRCGEERGEEVRGRENREV